MAAITTMNDGALYRLLAWLSPSYPVGAFSYSHGLEWVVEQGEVDGLESLIAWIETVLEFGSGRNDAILFHAAYDAALAGDPARVSAIAELAAAYAQSHERRLESISQGGAFCRATLAAWPGAMVGALAEHPAAYPVAVAVAAADHAIPVDLALGAYLQGIAANLVSAGLRLIPLGHSDGQRAIARLERAVARTTALGLSAGLDDLGSATPLADIASMLHETQYTRLFRS